MNSAVWTRSTRGCSLLIVVGVAAVIVGGGTAADVSSAAERFPVTIRVDAGKPIGPLRPIWRFFGADEPNYAYMRDGVGLLTELGQLAPRRVYFRTHNLLTSGDGTPALKWGSTNAYREDAQGRPVYDWTIVDRIFDTYLERGVRPYVQIGFMPQDLSTRPMPYQHSWTPMAKYDEIFTGWAYPPKDYGRWRDLVHAWVTHCVDRYGRTEVEGWYWQVWNEANIGYWQGTPEEFHKLHDYAIDGVRRALSDGQGRWPRHRRARRIVHARAFSSTCCAARITPPGASARRSISCPSMRRDGPRSWTVTYGWGLRISSPPLTRAFASSPHIPSSSRLPIVIGESDPDGCAACQGPQLGYRNTTMYSSYTAASMARLHDLADKHGANLEGALTWAFEFENQPYFAGFRALASNGIALPVLNVFRAFGRMGGDRIAVTSDAAVTARCDREDRRPRSSRRRSARQPGRQHGFDSGVALPRR